MIPITAPVGDVQSWEASVPIKVPAGVAGTSLNHITVYLASEDGESINLIGDRWSAHAPPRVAMTEPQLRVTVSLHDRRTRRSVPGASSATSPWHQGPPPRGGAPAPSPSLICLEQWGAAGRLARLSRMWGEGVPRSRLGAKRACGGSSPSLAALARLGAGAGHTTLSPTPLRGIGYPQAPKSPALSLGLPSYPP